MTQTTVQGKQLDNIDASKVTSGQFDSARIDDTGIDHTSLQNIGSSSHATIDSHIGDATIHFTAASLNLGTKADLVGSPSQVDPLQINQAAIDHGSIGGLTDDDHTQYHNDTRGDIRYYTQSQLDAVPGDGSPFGGSPVPVGAKIDKVAASTVNAIATMTAGGEIQDSLVAAGGGSPAGASFPILPSVEKGRLSALGFGNATEPTGTIVFVTDDASGGGSPATQFVLAYVDDTATWVRSNTTTPIV